MNALFRETFYAKDEADYRENIWKKHPDERGDSYDYFIRYVCANDRVIEAYRLFLLDKGEVSEEDLQNIKKIPTKFQNLYNGRDAEGRDIKGFHDYAERKDAFSKTGLQPPPRVLEASVDDVKALRVALIRQERMDAQMLHEQWLFQMAAFKIDTEKKYLEGVSSNNQNSQTLNNLIKAYEGISFLQRRAAGMTDKAEESLIEEASQEVEIIYTETEINTAQFEPIDYASLESFDKIIRADNYEEILDRLSQDAQSKSDKENS